MKTRFIVCIYSFLILLGIVVYPQSFSAGDVDTTFTQGTGANGAIYAKAVQSDGKVIIGGNFTSYDGTARNRIARLNADGTIDTAFNPGTGADAIVRTIAIQSDGKIVIGGSFTTYNGTGRNYIARINANGTLDTTFNPGTGASSAVNIVKIDDSSSSTGDIYIGGNFATYDGTSRMRIARVNTNGTLDANFDPGTGVTGGQVYEILFSENLLGTDIVIGGDFTTVGGYIRNRLAKMNETGGVDLGYNAITGANGTIYDSATQSDGKIIIVGDFTNVNGSSYTRIARLNTNLTIDTTFNTASATVGPDGIVRAVVLQSDGKIIIGGDFLNYNGVGRKRIARINTDGTLDTAYSTPTTGFDAAVYDLALQSDGKVIAVGNFTTTDGYGVDAFARLLATTGGVDSSFNWGLVGVRGANALVRTVAIEASGQVVIGGDFTVVNGVEKNKIARLTTTGAVITGYAGFDMTDPLDNYPYAKVALSNGQMLIGGTFTTVKSVSKPYLARINIDGSLDTTFNSAGAGPNSYVFALAQQSDGKIIIGGYFTTYNGTARNYIARINADGTLDATFNPGTGANSYVYSLALQSDGKILVGGYFTTFNGVSKNYIVRLNADGNIDHTFNPGTASNDIIDAHAIQSDGKILVGGQFTTMNGISKSYIARINTNGTLDTTFNAGGAGPNTQLEDIEVQSDGKIYISGAFTSYNGTAKNYFARLNSNGSLDSAFNASGAGPNNTTLTIKLQSDGKILIGGLFTSYNGTARNRIARINTDGTLDTGFNPGTGANNQVTAVDTQSDGKIVIGGTFTSYNGVDRNRVARLASNGTLDQSFITGTSVNSTVWSRAVQSDGKVIVGGIFTNVNGQAKNYLTRFNTDGSIDTTFNAGGAGPNNYIYSIALQSDGKILIGGYFTTYNGSTANYVARLNSNGTLDGTFSSGSGPYSGGAYTPYVYAIAIQSDGKIMIGGAFTRYNATSRSHVLRVNSNGSVDMTYNPATGTNGSIWGKVVQSTGKIIVVGQFTAVNGVARNYIARINTDGTLDTTFNMGTGANSTIQGILEQPDGKLLISGTFTTYNGTGRARMARLNADGSLDTGFTIGTGFNGATEPIALQSDGKIVVGGSFTVINGVAKNYIARLNTDGSLDTTFPSAGALANNSVTSITIQPADQKIIVGGNFTTFNGTALNRIVRLNTNGTNDATFTIGTGFNGAPENFYLQTDGKLIAVGAFTTYNATSRPYITRINTNGTIDTGFTPGTGGNAAIKAAEIQTDGTILIGGSFTTYNGTARTRIARLLSNGTIDTTYSTTTGANAMVEFITKLSDGTILIGGDFTQVSSVNRTRIAKITSTGANHDTFNSGDGTNSYVYSIGIQTDGKVVMGGYFTTYNGVTRNYLLRTNIDGSLDTSYSVGTGGNNIVYTLKLQSDNKAVIGGYFTTYNGTTRNRIARINTNGSLDTTFLATGAGANSYVYAIDIQSDGKMLIGGSFTTYNATARGFFARVNSDGSLDTTYATGAGANSNVLAIGLFSDGTAFLGGDFGTYDGSTRTRVAKVTTTGTLHSDFDAGIGANGTIREIRVQSGDQKVIVAGDFTNFNNVARNRIVRLNTNGTIDSGFSIGTGFNNDLYELALQSDGKILVGGLFTTYNAATANRITRLNTNGTIDATFTPGTGAGAGVYAVAIESGGSIILGGDFQTINAKARTRIARLNSDGTLATTFDPGKGTNDYVYSINVQTDGKIILGGYFTQYNFAANEVGTQVNGTNGAAKNYLVRITSNGEYDSTFATGTGPNSQVLVSKIQSDGKVIIGGNFTTYNGTAGKNYFTRLSSNGSLDATFTNGTSLNNNPFDIDIQSDGKILIGGTFTTYNGVARVRYARANADGTLDTTFAPVSGANSNVRIIAQRTDGKIFIGGDFGTVDGLGRTRNSIIDDDGTVAFHDGMNGSVYKVLVQPNGRIVAVGHFTEANAQSRVRAARFLTTGFLDTTFDPGTGFNSIVQTVAIQSDNKLIFGGNFGTYNGTTTTRAVRTNAAGAYDSTFNIGTGFNNTVLNLMIESAGTVIANGDFTIYNGSGRSRLARINTDGSVTSDMEPPAGFNGAVRALWLETDGKILAGGDFTSYNGTTRNALARINTDGTLNTSFSTQTNAGGSIQDIFQHALDNKTIVAGTFTDIGGHAMVNIARLDTDTTVDTNFNPGTSSNAVIRSAVELNGKVLIGGDFTSHDGATVGRIARLHSTYTVPSSVCQIPWNRAWTATADCSLNQSAKVFGNLIVGSNIINLPNGRVLGMDLTTNKITFTTGKILLNGTAKIDNSVTNGFLQNVTFSNGAAASCPTGMHVLTASTPQSAFVTGFDAIVPKSGTMYCAYP